MDMIQASIKLRTIERADRLFMEIYEATDCVEPVELTEPDKEGYRTFRIIARDRPDSTKRIRKVYPLACLLIFMGFDVNGF